MKLSIIILNFNTPVLTLNCLKSLESYYRKDFQNNRFEIILVDNRSEDNSVDFLEKEIKKRKWKVMFLKSNINMGFGGGCNLGAAKASGEYLLFLNSDTRVEDSSIKKIMDFAEQERALIVGGRLKNEDGSNQESCGNFPNLFHSIMILLGLGRKIIHHIPQKTQKVDWVSGGCLLIERNLFEKLGGFDRKMFMYFEDVELCYRAKKKGVDRWYYSESQIIHSEGKSSNTSFNIIHTYKGYLYFYKKYKSRLEYLLVNMLFKLKFNIYFLYVELTKNKNMINIYSKIK